MRRKITVVGAGNVGATTAQRLAERDYADVVLVDIVEGLPQGKALDLNQAGPVVGYEANMVGHQRLRRDRRLGHRRHHLRAAAQAGHEPRRPAGPRTRGSSATYPSRWRSARPTRSSSSSPTRSTRCATWRSMPQRFPRQRVIGMAGVLDSARFRTFLAWELGVSVAT